jgi:hypothetical protein
MIVSHARVTIDGFYIDDQTYWTLSYSACLQFTVLCHTQTHFSVHSHVFPIRCLVAATKEGRSPSSWILNCPRPQLPASHSISSQGLDLRSLALLITSRHGLCTTHRTSVAIQLLSWKHVCLRSRYLATDVVQLLISRSLPINRSTCRNNLTPRRTEWL